MSISVSQVFWPRGRTNRAPLWVGNFFWTFLNRVLYNLVNVMPDPANAQQFAIFSDIVGLIGAYIVSSLFIGRLHDIDRSGWWSLPRILPAMVLGAVKDSPELSELFGRLFKGQELLVGVVVGIVVVVCSLYVGLKRGTQGPNRFGPDPVAKPIPA